MYCRMITPRFENANQGEATVVRYRSGADVDYRLCTDSPIFVQQVLKRSCGVSYMLKQYGVDIRLLEEVNACSQFTILRSHSLM